jgi:oligosaccharide 4-alpha-D-glucosyltransferase
VRRACLSFVTLLALMPAAQADFGEYRSHQLVDQTLVVTTDEGELRLTAIDDAAIEVQYLESGLRQLPSFALAGPPPPLDAAVAETDRSIAFAIDGLIAVIGKSPVRIDFLRNGETLVAEETGYYAAGEARGFRFVLDDGEKILGGGERVLGMDRRGQRMPLYNKAHYGYETESRQMYYGLPAILS